MPTPAPRSPRSLVTAALGLALLAPASTAQDWARFRGPGGSGVRADARLPHALSGEHVAWRVPVGGAGHSSPVLWGERVFLTREGPAEGRRSVVAFSLADGAELWSHDDAFEAHRNHSLNSNATATPAVDASGVYVSWTAKDGVHALALSQDGELLWSRRLGPHSSQHGGGNSPVLWGDLLVVANEHQTSDSFLVALDRATGKTRWRIERAAAPERAAYAAPVLLERDGAAPLLVVASTAHGLTAVDPARGEVAWELDLGLGQRCVGVPAVAGEFLIVSAGSGGGGKECAIVRLPRGVDGSPEVVHRPRRNLPYVPGHLALDGRFYLFSDGGIASCLASDSGETLWNERLDGTFFSSPVSNGRTIWIASREGRLLSFAPGPEFAPPSVLDLGAPVFATPALGVDRMVVRTADELVCLAAE